MTNRGRFISATAGVLLLLGAASPTWSGRVVEQTDVPGTTVPSGARLGRDLRTVTVSSPARPFATAVEAGIELKSSTQFTLDAAARFVHVTYDATVTNLSPPSLGSYSSSYTYIPRFGVPTLKEAVNFVATKPDGTPLPVTIEQTDSDFVSVAVVDFEPDLFFQDAGVFHLTYDLPPMGPRSAGITRLNDAFATFPVFALGDPGLTSVEVVVPERFDVELVGDDLDKTDRDGQQVYSSGPIDDPAGFQVDIVARDDDKLVDREVEIGDHDATVLGWPGDDQWVDFVSQQIERGVPHLADTLGLEWPADQDVDVVETVSPYLYGYAGWFQLDDGLIEIGDELDELVILHELSHAWFNDGLYDSRWINEGLADAYAAETIGALGGTAPTPRPVDLSSPGAQALNVWAAPDLRADVSDEQESYGYNRSWSLVQRLIDEIGLDRVSEVVRASKDRVYPYGAPGHDARMNVGHTWMQFLDLLVDLGGSTTAEATFRAEVASPDDVALMDQRSVLRATYDQLEADAGGWAAPFAVRMPMSKWQLGLAEQRLGQARELLPLLGDVTAGFDALGIRMPAAVRETWERTEELPELRAELEAQAAATRAVSEALDARSGGPLALVGLAGTRADLRLVDAQSALAAGDVEAARRTATAVTELYEHAAASALARTIAVALLVGLALLIRRTGARVPHAARDRLDRLARRSWRLLRPIREVPGILQRAAGRVRGTSPPRSAPSTLAPPLPPLPPPALPAATGEPVVPEAPARKRAPRQVQPGDRSPKPRTAPPRKATSRPRPRASEPVDLG